MAAPSDHRGFCCKPDHRRPQVVAYILTFSSSMLAEAIHSLAASGNQILVGAIIAESFSFRTAIIESNHVRGKQSWVHFVRNAKQPELPVILLEDLGALVGLIFALFGVGLTLLTGNGIWDAVGCARA